MNLWLLSTLEFESLCRYKLEICLFLMLRDRSISVAPDAGESFDYSDSFAVYGKQNVRGFYLRVDWERNLIYEMGNGLGYPRG